MLTWHHTPIPIQRRFMPIYLNTGTLLLTVCCKNTSFVIISLVNCTKKMLKVMKMIPCDRPETICVWCAVTFTERQAGMMLPFFAASLLFSHTCRLPPTARCTDPACFYLSALLPARRIVKYYLIYYII